MINFRKLLAVVIVMSSAFVSISAQERTLEELSQEGTRIGKIFKAATDAGDKNGQNAALKEIEAILVTLRTQEQVDAITNAFNECNVLISTPAHDAKAYTRALGNAKVSGDAVAIEDAQDIIVTVKKQYSKRSTEDAQLFDKYFEIANQALDLGLKSRQSTDNACDEEIQALRNKYADDQTLIKLINDTFGYFALSRTTVDNDAQIYAKKILDAQDSKSQSKLDNARRDVTYLYERYVLEVGEDKAQLFTDKLNELMKGRYVITQGVK